MSRKSNKTTTYAPVYNIIDSSHTENRPDNSRNYNMGDNSGSRSDSSRRSEFGGYGGYGGYGGWDGGWDAPRGYGGWDGGWDAPRGYGGYGDYGKSAPPAPPAPSAPSPYYSGGHGFGGRPRFSGGGDRYSPEYDRPRRHW